VPVVSILQQSPVQTVDISGFKIHVKRDDLLSDYFSGNKARKFAYFLDNDFPRIKKIVSYGSVQANSLYSLAALAKLKNWQLDYYVNRIPSWLKTNTNDDILGNYGGALTLGANIIEVNDDEIANHGNNLDDFMLNKAGHLTHEDLFIPEGGRSTLAQYGIEQLAQEIDEYCQQASIKQAYIMLPSGTGTTALFLQTWFNQQNSPHQVLTCACVGDGNYLQKQFAELNNNSKHWPTILATRKKYHFGKLYPEFYQMWKQLKDETTIEFDLLYDPLGWQVLLHFIKSHAESHIVDRGIIYIHQGGLVGNQTMLPRYQRKYSNTTHR